MSETPIVQSRHQYEAFLRQLPADWEQKEISQVGAVVGGGTPSRAVPSFWRGSIPWVTPGEVSDEAAKQLHDTHDHISASGLAGSGAHLLPAGSLMVTTRATLGARVINAVPMATNQGFKSIVFKKPEEASYFYHLFEMVKPELVRRASGTTFLEISGAEFGCIKVPSPAPEEKLKIAQLLDTLDTAIHQTEAIIKKLKQIKQGLLHDLLTRGVDGKGELRPSNEEAPWRYQDSPLGWIPKGWEMGTIESFLDNVIDYRGKTPAKTTNGIPLITAKNVRIDYIDEEPREFIAEASFDRWMTRGIPKKGDVLLTMEAPLGNVAQIDTESRIAFAQRIIILQSGAKLLPTYLKYLLLSEKFRKQLFSFGSGSTVEGIQQATFRKLLVAIPSSRVEQTLITGRLLAATEKILDEESALSKMCKLKCGLMDDLLTGRVRVTSLLTQ